MKRILFATVSAAALAACTPKVQQICEDVYIDKLNPSEQVCTDVAVEYGRVPAVTFDRSDRDRPEQPEEPEHPEEPKDPDTPEKPDEPADPDDPSNPDLPTGPDRPDKVKGDNSDANDRGGNRHDREDFTHEGTETAEDKKEVE